MFLMFIITARYLVYTLFPQANADVRDAHTRSLNHQSPRRLHCPQHGRVPRTSGVFCTLHQFFCVVMSKHVTNNLVLCREDMLY